MCTPGPSWPPKRLRPPGPGSLLADARHPARPSGQARAEDLVRYASELALDVDRFTRELRAHTWRDRVAADVESADLSGVAGTPSFFLNGQRHAGAYDIDTLSRSVRTARARAAISPAELAPAQQVLGGP